MPTRTTSQIQNQRKSLHERQISRSQLPCQVYNPQIIVVDNDSEDDTAVEAAGVGARVIHESRKGYGSAFLRGLTDARGEVLVLCDADGTYPIADAVQLISPIMNGTAELTIGSRFKGQMEPGAMPWLHRYLGNPILTWLQNRLFGTAISDAHCGMRAISRDAFLALDLSSTGMEFAAEMLIKSAQLGFRVIEMPISYRKRLAGAPKTKSFREGWRHLRFLVYSFWVIRVHRNVKKKVRNRSSDDRFDSL